MSKLQRGEGCDSRIREKEKAEWQKGKKKVVTSFKLRRNNELKHGGTALETGKKCREKTAHKGVCRIVRGKGRPGNLKRELEGRETENTSAMPSRHQEKFQPRSCCGVEFLERGEKGNKSLREWEVGTEELEGEKPQFGRKKLVKRRWIV